MNPTLNSARFNYRWLLLSALTSLILTACLGIQQEVSPSDFPPPPPAVHLAGADEPGTPLIIHAVVIDAETRQPVPDAQITLYQADANGEYQPSDPQDESTARLSGEVVSGDDGAFTIYTIVPRSYDQPGNQHIHLHSVRAEGYEAIGRVVLFEDDVNPEVRQWAGDTGFGIIIDLEERNGVQTGILPIPLVPTG